jgi:transcription factor C subunit 6
MVRQSARARKVISYVNDAYKDLDSDTAPGPPDEAVSSDEEFQLGPTDGAGPVDDDDDEEDNLSAVASSEAESEDSEPDSSDDGRPKSRGGSKAASFTPRRRAVDEEREPGSAPSVHRKHVRTVDSGKTGARRKARLLAEGASLNVIRAPDPTVRITYRPGFSKASGKKDRIIQVYGVENDAVRKAALVRDTWIGMPAVPERSCLAVTPFLKEEEEEIRPEGWGDSQQKAKMLEFEDGSEYLGEDGEPLGCVLGPVGKYQRAVFTRFGVYDLRKVWGEQKKGFLLNAGSQVLSMEWAANRPEGIPTSVIALVCQLLTRCVGCQYLAISTLSEGGFMRDKGKENAQEEQPPAYDRRPSKAAIQIWRFPVDEESAPVKDPSIALMLCYDWGPARVIKWCPIRQEFKDPRALGYLAAAFADGIARIFKVTLPQLYDPDSPDAEGCDFCNLLHLTFSTTGN